MDLMRKNLVAVSGGPDSLALTALTKAYSYTKIKFFYALINHNIRKNSHQEALKTKTLLKKINLKIFLNKKIERNIQAEAGKLDINYSQIIVKKGIKILLTGHNLEDQVRPFL